MGIAPHFPLATALTVGIIAIAGTLLIHTLATVATVNFFCPRTEARPRRKKLYDQCDDRFPVGFVALVAHLVDIALRALLFVVLKEFPDLAIAYYHSAVNYTTLGYARPVAVDTPGCAERRSWQLSRGADPAFVVPSSILLHAL